MKGKQTENASEPTKAELQEGLRDAGLPVSGSKAELVDRLEAAGVQTFDTTDGDTVTIAPAAADDQAQTDTTTDEAPATAVILGEGNTPPESVNQPERSDCVVDDGTPHTGRAVNGKVCSRHAMRYRADGKLRQ